MNIEELAQNSPQPQVLRIDKQSNDEKHSERSDNLNNDDINDTNDSNDKQIPENVLLFIKQLYEQNLMWDQVLQQSNSSKNTQLVMEYFNRDIKEDDEEHKEDKVVPNCDTDLKHLLHKLKFINQICDGMIHRYKALINSYQMKDFDK